MQIFIKYLTGQTFTLFVEPSDTVDKLKAMIQAKDRDNIDPKHQRLLYAGRQLEDGQPLEEYGIKNLCTINVLMRVLGGGRKCCS